MSRLTIKNSDGSYSQPTHTTFENMFYKLADLEDVLEEFGIESAEELRNRITVNKEFVKQVHKEVMQEQIEEIVKTYYGDIIEENQQLKSQLSKAIVPKFEIGQEVWFIDTRVNSFNEQRDVLERYLVDSIVFTKEQIRYYGDDGLWLGDNELFKTKAEAQAKLDEIRRK